MRFKPLADLHKVQEREKSASARLLFSVRHVPLCPFLYSRTNTSCTAHCPGMLEATETPWMPHEFWDSALHPVSSK